MYRWSVDRECWLDDPPGSVEIVGEVMPTHVCAEHIQLFAPRKGDYVGFSPDEWRGEGTSAAQPSFPTADMRKHWLWLKFSSGGWYPTLDEGQKFEIHDTPHGFYFCDEGPFVLPWKLGDEKCPYE